MYSNNSVAMKRIHKEQKDMLSEPSPYFYAEPLESEPFEWHFTIRGPDNSDYQGGYYHGLIVLPSSYPFKPPYIEFLTESGRFQIKEKICLTFTNYHPEYWQPAWTIRTILHALVSFMPVDEGQMSIGSMVAPKEERQKLARRSIEFVCDKCGPIKEVVRERIPKETEGDKAKQEQKFKETDQLFQFASEKALKQKKAEEEERKKGEEEVKEVSVEEQKQSSPPPSAKKAPRLHRFASERNPAFHSQKESQEEKLRRYREQGIKLYRQRLLQQLDSDCRKKLWTINLLFLLSLGLVLYCYKFQVFANIKI